GQCLAQGRGDWANDQGAIGRSKRAPRETILVYPVGCVVIDGNETRIARDEIVQFLRRYARERCIGSAGGEDRGVLYDDVTNAEVRQCSGWMRIGTPIQPVIRLPGGVIGNA